MDIYINKWLQVYHTLLGYLTSTYTKLDLFLYIIIRTKFMHKLELIFGKEQAIQL